MASRVQCDEFTKEAGSGTVAFPTGGADFSGNCSVSGNVVTDSLATTPALQAYTAASRPTGVAQGTLIWNSTFAEVQVWNGDRWINMETKGGVLPTQGMVLHLDATDTSSYNGSGTVWSDISGNGNNFNINANAHIGTTGDKTAYMSFINDTNGCAKNGGDISLSGSVTYVTVTRILNSSSTWRTLTRSYSADHHVIIQSGGWNIGMYDNNSVGFRGTGFSQQNLSGYASNAFMVMVWRFNNSDSPTYEFFVNGEKKGEIRDSNARYNRGFGSIGAYHDGSTNPTSSSQYWGDIRMFAAYNRNLSNTEITEVQAYCNSRGYLQ